MKKLILFIFAISTLLVGCKHNCYNYMEYNFTEEDGVQYVVESCKKCGNEITKNSYTKVKYDLAHSAISGVKSPFSNSIVYENVLGEEWTHDCSEYTEINNSIQMYGNYGKTIDSFICTKCEKAFYVVGSIVNIDSEYINKCLRTANEFNSLSEEEISNHVCLDNYRLCYDAHVHHDDTRIVSNGACNICGHELRFYDGYYTTDDGDKIDVATLGDGSHDCEYFTTINTFTIDEYGNTIQSGKCLRCDSILEFVNNELIVE